MKIQYLAVIFIVIMVPIAVVLSNYTQSQINTIQEQTSYSTKLQEATYDAVLAFQLNTVNNRYSSVSNSKIRDIEASANTFFTSLVDNMNSSGYDKDALQPYVPALVYTLYDGYYIYGKYKNVMPENGQVLNDIGINEYTWGLKPYVYYSCRYINGNEEVVINYTLDNFITIYHKVGNKFETKSGYLINIGASGWNKDNSTYNGISIQDSPLTEKLLFKTKNSSGKYEEGTYQYIIYQNQKIYIDGDRYFRYDDYQKTYFTEHTSTYNSIKDYIDNNKQKSATQYFEEAKEFSTWVNNNLEWVTQAKAVDEDGNFLNTKYWEDLNIATTQLNEPFLKTDNGKNDPFSSTSIFDEMRRGAIKRTITTNLTASIGAYNEYSDVNYEFALPVLKETDWNKIQNHICVLSFMQGLPIGSKIYNDYAILTNDKNEEFVSKDAIYITTQSADGNIEYHQPGCSRLIEDKDTDEMKILAENKIIEGYFNINFLKQTVRISEGNYLYFYPQAKNGKTCTGCYNCIVNAGGAYNIEDIITGKITDPNQLDGDGKPKVIYDATKNDSKNTKFKKVRSLYYSALARERYDLYKNNQALNQ